MVTKLNDRIIPTAHRGMDSKAEFYTETKQKTMMRSERTPSVPGKS